MKNGKVKVGIIGTGNIGSDLLVKIQRSKFLECGIFTGKNKDSLGIARAKSMGITTSFESIEAILKNPDSCEIVFDATTADSHKIHAPILKKLGKFTVDMTPSRVGFMCIPSLNLDESLKYDNVNMITCGGQATAPILRALVNIHPDVDYVEIVASIASKSAGMGTRNNIDEYTQTTAEAIKTFSGVKRAKAIIVLNPAEPPILMHNTIYANVKAPKLGKLKREVEQIVADIRKYVPGYKLILGPVAEGGRLIMMNEVVGQGDFLPKYAGNLDIINSAAVMVAEEYARKKLL